MSLIAHYPLNGTLEDYSINNTTATNYNATVINGGPLNTCYSFNGTNSYLTFPNKLSYGNIFSVSFWCKFNNTTVNQSILTSRMIMGEGISLFFLFGSTSGNIIRFDSGDQYSIPISGLSLNTTDFFHFVFIRDNNSKYVYMNGNLIGSTTVTINTFNMGSIFSVGSSIVESNNSNGNYFNGYIGDLKLYNHALSVNEVKELYKCKILHYDMNTNSNIINPVNTYPTFNTSTSTGGWLHWGDTGNIGSYSQTTDKNFIFNKNNTYAHMIANGTDATKNYVVYQVPEYDGGYRCIQAIIKHKDSSQINDSICYPTWNATTSLSTPNNQWTSIQYLHDGFYLCKCEGVYQDGSNDLIGIYVTAGNQIYISECCIENKKYCSDIFQLHTGIVPDCSGYRNNGTIALATSPSYSTETNIGNGCYEFNNGLISTNTTFTNGTDLTISAWVYLNSYNSERCIIGIAYRSFYLTINNAGKLSAYCYGKSPAGYIDGSTIIPLNTWTHITEIWNSTTLKGYVNGLLDINVACTGNIAQSSNLSIGYETEMTTRAFNGKISDFRIYATALSDTDIKELYQTKAKIDNDGNMYCNYINELSSNNLCQPDLTPSVVLSKTNNVYTTVSVGEITNLSYYQYIPVNPNDNYKYSIKLRKNANMTDSSISFLWGISEYDTFKNIIRPDQICRVNGTQTTLAIDLNVGDTTATLTSSSNWYIGTYQHLNICDYPGYQNYERGSFKFIKFDAINDNVLTLHSAWPSGYGNIPAGTPVMQTYGSSTYHYLATGSISSSTEWTIYNATSKCPRTSVAYVKPFIFSYTANGIDFKDASMENITNPQSYPLDKFDIESTGIINTSDINEIGIPIRYIRDYCNGNSVNVDNHWCEIQVYHMMSENIARGKTVTISTTTYGITPSTNTYGLQILTNGDTSSTPYIYQQNSGLQYIQVDLGFIEMCKEIKVWHYWADGRTYNVALLG